MIIRLTDIALRKLSNPTNGQATYWDETTPSFGIRCSSKSKSFVVMYGPKRRLKTLGRYPTLLLADARKQAKTFLYKYGTLSEDQQKQAMPFKQAQALFLSDCRTRNKERTVRDYERLLNRHFPLRNDLHTIDRKAYMKIISSLAITPSEQSHAFMAIRTMLNWCVRQGLLEHNTLPLMSFKKPSRARIFTEYELKTVYRLTQTHPYPFGPIVQLMILTGQRRGEVALLRRSWIQKDHIVFPSHMTKNGREHHLPISKTTQILIKGLPETCDMLFPSRHDDERPFNGWSKCKKQFDLKLENVEPYTLHDLRRTYSSTHAMLGTAIHVTEKLLNHVSGTVSGVAAVYNRHTYIDEMRDAVEQYDVYIDNLITD